MTKHTALIVRGSKIKARVLRRRQTESENILWKALRNRKLNGLKFRRQVALGRYIVDFICVEEKIIIEVDGSSHIGRDVYDNNRDRFFRSHGLKTLRFTNIQIKESLDLVLEKISREISARTSNPSLSQNGRGLG